MLFRSTRTSISSFNNSSLAAIAKYKDEILPHNVRARLSIEMASDFGWHKYVGLDGKTMSVNKFGASAPADIVIKNYGFTVENVVKNVKDIL